MKRSLEMVNLSERRRWHYSWWDGEKWICRQLAGSPTMISSPEASGISVVLICYLERLGGSEAGCHQELDSAAMAVGENRCVLARQRNWSGCKRIGPGARVLDGLACMWWWQQMAVSKSTVKQRPKQRPWHVAAVSLWNEGDSTGRASHTRERQRQAACGRWQWTAASTRRCSERTAETKKEADEWAQFQFKIQAKIKSAPNLIWLKHYRPSLKKLEIKY
jgi:hypothetical protein